MQTARNLKQAKVQMGLNQALCCFAVLMVFATNSAIAATTAVPASSSTQAAKKSVQAKVAKNKKSPIKKTAKKSATKSSSKLVMRSSSLKSSAASRSSLGDTSSASTMSLSENSMLAQPSKKSSGIPAANATVSNSSLKAKLEEPKKTFAFTNSLSITTAASLDSNEPTSYSGSYLLALGVRHNPSGIAAGTKVSYSREYSYQRDDGTDGGLENPSFSLSKGFKSGKDFKTTLVDSVGLSLGAALPGNREAERRTFLGSIGPNLSIAKEIGRTSLSQAFGYTRLFFEYDIRDNGVVNSPDSYRSVSSLGYSLTDELSLSASLALIHTVSFQGVGRSMQSVSFSTSYQAMEKLGLTLGVSTDRPTLGPDGQSNLITLYDSRAASAFFDLTMSY